MPTTSQLGRSAELRLTAALLENGLRVFDNVEPSGPADIIAWDGVRFYPIDAKKLTRRVLASGLVSRVHGNYGKNRIPGIYYVGWDAVDKAWYWLGDDQIPEALQCLF